MTAADSLRRWLRNAPPGERYILLDGYPDMRQPLAFWQTAGAMWCREVLRTGKLP